MELQQNGAQLSVETNKIDHEESMSTHFNSLGMTDGLFLLFGVSQSIHKSSLTNSQRWIYKRMSIVTDKTISILI